MGPGAWPPNRGFVKVKPVVLQPGTKIDRYGGWMDNGKFKDSGTFASPAGASFGSRALPQNTLNKPLNTYEVVKPVKADAGPAIPWFGQPGKGTQYELSKSIDELLKQGAIRKI